MWVWKILATTCCLYVISTWPEAMSAPAPDDVPFIVGGHEVTDDTEYPFMAALTVKVKIRGQPYLSFTCGAAIISDQWILTAAHCVTETKGRTVRRGDPLDYIVRVGSADLVNGQFTDAPLSDIFLHESYNPNSLDNDIALVKLVSPLTLTAGSSINSAPLAGATDEASDHNPCTIMGWGVTSGSDPSPETVLRDAQIEALPDANCNAGPTVICVKNIEGITGPCYGDSGSPFICDNKIYGVTSYVTSTSCDPNFRSGYTDVTKYLDWIADKMSNN